MTADFVGPSVGAQGADGMRGERSHTAVSLRLPYTAARPHAHTHTQTHRSGSLEACAAQHPMMHRGPREAELACQPSHSSGAAWFPNGRSTQTWGSAQSVSPGVFEIWPSRVLLLFLLLVWGGVLRCLTGVLRAVVLGGVLWAGVVCDTRYRGSASGSATMPAFRKAWDYNPNRQRGASPGMLSPTSALVDSALGPLAPRRWARTSGVRVLGGSLIGGICGDRGVKRRAPPVYAARYACAVLHNPWAPASIEGPSGTSNSRICLFDDGHAHERPRSGEGCCEGCSHGLGFS